MRDIARLRHLVFTVLCCCLVLAPGSAIANPITEIENQGNALVFYPIQEFEKLVLTITGPCDYEYRQVILAGETPSFALDETTIDGQYRFQILRTEKVDPGIAKSLASARKAGDRETAKALCRAGKLPAAPSSQSSGFTVANGKIVFDRTPEESTLVVDEPSPIGVDGLLQSGSSVAPKGAVMPGFALKDFVILDDLIVDGSACVGFSCVNGESFGFDTLRLKEQNLRLKFDDTSNALSYPRTDWQLTANDTANGGLNRFSIDDITAGRTPFTVEGGARNHALYVDDAGRIGAGISTPSEELHLVVGDTPTLRLQQDGSAGFSTQTWDVAGNDAGFFIRDVTGGSDLPFRIRPGAPDNAIHIVGTGDVGLGTASPDSQLHVFNTDGNTQLKVEENNATVNNSRTLLLLENNGAVRFNMTNSSLGDSWVFIGPQSNQNLVINNTGNAGNEFELEENGDLTLAGTLTITGGCTGCDAVLTQDWPLESIEEHAEQMWKNNYLPAVGPTPEGQTSIDVFAKTTGILQELEKAHVYIEQLHTQMQEMRAGYEKRLAALEAALEE